MNLGNFKKNSIFRYGVIITLLDLFFILLNLYKIKSGEGTNAALIVDNILSVMAILFIAFFMFLGWNLAVYKTKNNVKTALIFLIVNTLMAFYTDKIMKIPSFSMSGFFLQFLGISLLSYFVGKVFLKKNEK